MRDPIRLAVSVFLALVGLPAAASQPTRTWEFDLVTPGTYKVQVQHTVPVPPGTKVSYTISIGPNVKTRELEPVGNRPFIPLIADVPGALKMQVSVAGLPQSALRRTTVYAYNADYIPYWEYFDPSKNNGLEEIERVRKLLAQPDEKIDLTKFKLAIDKLANPGIDVDKALNEIDAMVRRVRKMPEFGPSPTSKAIALQRFIYNAGSWNGERAFEYDLDDPLGSNPNNKLLAAYLSSRKGNCVTMPFLFIILGQRLGIDVTASTAPNHLFVKFRNELGLWINLEATSGASPTREIWIRQQNPSITDKAIESGIYLQPLTKKETAAVMAGLLPEHYFKQEEYQRTIAAVDLLLAYYPKDVTMITMKGAAYGRLARQYMAGMLQSSPQRPPAPTWYYEHLLRSNHEWFAKAEALGWREETREEKQKYLEHIKTTRQEKMN